jgi:hypothetical protein
LTNCWTNDRCLESGDRCLELGDRCMELGRLNWFNILVPERLYRLVLD